MSWCYERYGRINEEYSFDIFDNDTSIICGSTGLVTECSARRIVAGMNALEHISTETLETGAMYNLVQHYVKIEQQRDELLAALKDVIWFIAPTPAQGGVHFESQAALKKAYEQACDAIDKSESC